MIRAGRFASAVPYLDYIISHDPRDNVSKRLRKSIAIILNTPKSPDETEKTDKRIQLAKMYLTIGIKDKAAGYIEQVLKMDPSNAQAKLLST